MSGAARKAGRTGVAVALLVAGCSESPAPASSAAARGRQVYLGQCAACHAADPAQTGPLGPPLKGSSRELLEAKVLRGAYPPGYAPKRSTRVMPRMPVVAPDIPALAEYLQ